MIWIGKLPETPVGPIWLAASPSGLLALVFADQPEDLQVTLPRRTGEQPALAQEEMVHYLAPVESYLHGYLRNLSFDVDWRGIHPFQRAVLEATAAIPCGEVRTYGQLAHQLGRPRSARAVGRALATNPLPLVLPCHRVVGSDGDLRGYGGPGGTALKAWLLQLEAESLPVQQRLPW
ncbi:MAG: methylated-DNA--[protein]-cysteine S-methyltransferase [Candidatus Promineifilaceae bacterium]